jgi:hypothetical protein
MVENVQRQAFHLSIHISPEAGRFWHVLMQVLADLTIEVVHRKKWIVPNSSRPRGQGPMPYATEVK